MTEKIAIVTDSTCDIPSEIVEQLGIRVLPLRIVYENGEYRDNVDITAQEVYDSLEREIPSTSLPSPEEVLALFEELKKEGITHVLAIHISSGLSGTSQLIRNLASQVQDLVVEVIDSKSISMGLGYTVIEAARKLKEGVDFAQVRSHAEEYLKRMKVYFVLNTLEYLKKGGRIGKVSGTLGEILSLKPIITVTDEGIYETYAKVRGRKKSIDKMFEIVKEHLSKPLQNIAVCHGSAKQEAQEMMNKVKQLGNAEEVMMTHVSPVIGVHTGPGTLGLVVYSKE